MTRVDPCYAALTDLLRKACLPGLHPKTLRDPNRSPKARPVPLRLRWGLSRPGPVQGTFPVTKSSQYRRDSFKHGAVQHENFLWIVPGVSLGVGWGRAGKALWPCRLGQSGYGLWMPVRFLRLRRAVWRRTGRFHRVWRRFIALERAAQAEPRGREAGCLWLIGRVEGGARTEGWA